MKRFVVVTDSATSGRLFRRGVCLGGCDLWHGTRWATGSTAPHEFQVATIPAVAGESLSATYARVSAALGPRQKSVRPLLRSVCERVA
jgi:hypothetical protein